jgi:hypothetical protein
MSKNRRRNPHNKFVMLERWFWRCEAFQALPHAARSLYIELEMLYTGSNNGHLFLSVRDAAALLGTGMRQARAAIKALEDGGFIRATRKGTRTRRGEQRLATSWCLTKHANDVNGTPATSDFMRLKKNQTVSPEDTDRVPRGHATPPNDPEKHPDRVPRGHAQAHFEGVTVSPEDTHLLYHHRDLELEGLKPRAAPPDGRADPPRLRVVNGSDG